MKTTTPIKPHLLLLIIISTSLLLAGCSDNNDTKPNTNTSLKITEVGDMVDEKSATYETTDEKIINDVSEMLETKEALTNKTPSEVEPAASEYEIDLTIDSKTNQYKLFDDSIEDHAIVTDEESVYEINLDFAEYIFALYRYNDISTDLDSDVVDLFAEYNWTIDYKIGTVNDTIEDIKNQDRFNPNPFYYVFNNDLSKDIGMDFSEQIGQEITADLYKIRESVGNNKDIFTPGRGIIIKDSNDKIIGAFINGIGVSEENAWSLKNRSHQKVTGYDFHDWFNKMGITYDTDKKLAACKPEEIIKKFFRAQEEKNTQLLDTYEDKETLYRYATSSVPYHELYSKDGPKLMMGSGAMELDNVKLINIKKVQNLDADVYNKYYDVTYKASYKDEPDEGTKTYPVTFHMTYESKGAGWKIKSRGH